MDQSLPGVQVESVRPLVDDDRRPDRAGGVSAGRVDGDPPRLVLGGAREDHDDRDVALQPRLDVSSVEMEREPIRGLGSEGAARLALDVQRQAQRLAIVRVVQLDVAVDTVIDAVRLEDEPHLQATPGDQRDALLAEDLFARQLLAPRRGHRDHPRTSSTTAVDN
ncbi:hypothetical protein ND748_11980 [Frankia sp. AiPs1]|nr:hypothetical protein [Frankia sp. AiPs1]MCM3922373.1 hypothetical protein [Frankia sp. AiPs1]